MRSVLLLALVSIGCKGAAKPADATTLRWRPPAVHDRSTHTRTTALALEITPADAAKPTALREEHDETRVTEVIAVEGDHATKVKVRYDKVESRQKLGDDERVGTGAHQGKIYVVWLDGADVRVSADDGRDVPAVERDSVSADVGDELGRIPGMEQVILGSAWRQGVTVQLTAPELALMTEAQKDARARSGTITFDGVTGERATFHAAIEASLSNPEGELSTSQTITIAVDVASGRVTDATVDATLEGTLQRAKATGTLTAAVHATWGP